MLKDSSVFGICRKVTLLVVDSIVCLGPGREGYGNRVAPGRGKVTNPGLYHKEKHIQQEIRMFGNI